MEFIFLDNGLTAVDLSFARNRFGDLRRVFVERYGRPTRVDEKGISWDGKKSSVYLSVAGGGYVATREYLVYFDETIKEKTKKAAKDL